MLVMLGTLLGTKNQNTHFQALVDLQLLEDQRG